MKWSDIWEIWEICEISWDRAKWWPDWGKMSRRWLLWGPNWELNKVLVTSIAIFKLDPILAYIWKSELCQHFARDNLLSLVQPNVSSADHLITGEADHRQKWFEKFSREVQSDRQGAALVAKLTPSAPDHHFTRGDQKNPTVRSSLGYDTQWKVTKSKEP